MPRTIRGDQPGGPFFRTPRGVLRTRLHPERVRALGATGVALVPVESAGLSDGLRALAEWKIQSILLEGGAAVHQAAWNERLVDYVQLYVAPLTLGPQGVPLLEDQDFSIGSLVEQQVRPIGPDTLIEGYVHRPH